MTIYEDFSSSFICSVVLVTSTLLIGLPHQYFSQSWKNKISSPIIFLLEIESFTLGVFTLPLPVCGIIGSSNASLVFFFLTNCSLDLLWPDHCWDGIALNYEQGKFILRLEMASVCDKVPLCDWNVIQLLPPTTHPPQRFATRPPPANQRPWRRFSTNQKRNISLGAWWGNCSWKRLGIRRPICKDSTNARNPIVLLYLQDWGFARQAILFAVNTCQLKHISLFPSYRIESKMPFKRSSSLPLLKNSRMWSSLLVDQFVVLLGQCNMVCFVLFDSLVLLIGYPIVSWYWVRKTIHKSSLGNAYMHGPLLKKGHPLGKSSKKCQKLTH